jgi:hypothetical protein
MRKRNEVKKEEKVKKKNLEMQAVTDRSVAASKFSFYLNFCSF